VLGGDVTPHDVEGLIVIHAYLPWNHPAAWGSRPWLRDAEQSVTYDDGAQWTERVAAQLVQAGVGAGDVVAVMLANRVELPVVLMAAWRIGASVTPVNPALCTAEALYQIGDIAGCASDVRSRSTASADLVVQASPRGAETMARC